MDSAAADRERKARTFLEFCIRRFDDEQEDEQEERIAAEMGFGSAEALHKQLENDGSPVCGVCGVLYPEPDHREAHEPKERKRRPGVGGGLRVRLPRTGDARGLFRKALAELEEFMHFAEAEEGWVEGGVKEGRFEGKRFITHSVERGVREVADRREYTEEGWRRLCEELGADPELEEQVTVSVADEASPGGVSRTPSSWLVALVGAYALAGRPLAPLVEELHHDPASVDAEGLQRSAANLRKAAGQLGARVRGRVVGGGRPIEGVSRREHFLVWRYWKLMGRLRELTGQKISSPEKLCGRLKEEFPRFAGDLAPDDVRILIRLAHSRLGPPE